MSTQYQNYINDMSSDEESEESSSSSSSENNLSEFDDMDYYF